MSFTPTSAADHDDHEHDLREVIYCPEVLQIFHVLYLPQLLHLDASSS